MTDRLTLSRKVDAWLIRDDVGETGDHFDEILLIAESYIAQDVRCVVQEQTTTLTFDGRSEDLPANYNGLRYLFNADAPKDKIEYMTPEVLRQSSVWTNGRVGSFFTIEGGSQTTGDERVQITIAGPASATDTLDLEALYWARFAALTNDTDTNWLLANHFNVYLYATLRAAAELIQEDVLEDRYETKYRLAVDLLNRNEQRKRYGAIPKQAYGSPRGIV